MIQKQTLETLQLREINILWQALTFVDFTEGSSAELFNDSIAFLQNFLALYKHLYFYYNIFLLLFTLYIPLYSNESADLNKISHQQTL